MKADNTICFKKLMKQFDDYSSYFRETAVLSKKMFWKISQNPHENTCAGLSF